MKTQNQTDHCDKTNKEYSWLIPHCKPELKEIASWTTVQAASSLVVSLVMWLESVFAVTCHPHNDYLISRKHTCSPAGFRKRALNKITYLSFIIWFKCWIIEEEKKLLCVHRSKIGIRYSLAGWAWVEIVKLWHRWQMPSSHQEPECIIIYWPTEVTRQWIQW